MNEINCQTLQIKALTEEIHRVRLQPTQGDLFTFKGGQYLCLIMPNGKKIPLSIASPPEQTDFIEVHIRLIPGHDLAAEMLELFKASKNLIISGPHGECCLRESPNDVVIIAGGTGFSPMKSLLESAIANAETRHFSLYLGAQKSSELYQTELVNDWQLGQCQFNYIPVIAEPEVNWQGEVGFPHQIAINQLADKISQIDFYISGSEMMVMNVYQALLEAGARKNSIYSDILDIKRIQGIEI